MLMNKQEEVMVGLAHVPHRRYSPGLKITTVGEWGGDAPNAGGMCGWGGGGQALQISVDSFCPCASVTPPSLLPT